MVYAQFYTTVTRLYKCYCFLLRSYLIVDSYQVYRDKNTMFKANTAKEKDFC